MKTLNHFEGKTNTHEIEQPSVFLVTKKNITVRSKKMLFDLLRLSKGSQSTGSHFSLVVDKSKHNLNINVLGTANLY